MSERESLPDQMHPSPVSVPPPEPQVELLLRQVIDTNPNFVFAKDRYGRFVLVNQAFAETYNTTIEQMIGKTDADFNPNPVQVEQFRRDDLQVFALGQDVFVPEQRTRTAQGGERWWQTVKRPIRDAQGEVTAVLTIVTEITERKLIEDALREARDIAVEASRLKSELLAKASHELQTPLGAILGYTEMLETGFFGAINGQQQEILQKIIGRTQHLSTLITNLLDQSHFASQNTQLHQSEFLVQDLVRQLHDNFAAQAAEKGLTFTTEIVPNFPPMLLGAVDQVLQILSHLVTNALKFTANGRVHVRIYQPEGPYWAIDVQDTGIGIPAVAHELIFEPFRQVDGSITRRHQGFGLGLSLAHELALAMEGRIELSSEEGQGSTFTVLLPCYVVMEGGLE
jgi:PAS domain S-box-containing protein